MSEVMTTRSVGIRKVGVIFIRREPREARERKKENNPSCPNLMDHRASCIDISLDTFLTSLRKSAPIPDTVTKTDKVG